MVCLIRHHKYKRNGKGNGNVKVYHRTGHKGLEGEERYSFTLSLNSTIEGGWVVNATPRPFYPLERGLVHIYRWLGGPQGRSARVRKISPPAGNRSPDRSARSESLYRVSYPGPLLINRWSSMMIRWSNLKAETSSEQGVWLMYAKWLLLHVLYSLIIHSSIH